MNKSLSSLLLTIRPATVEDIPIIQDIVRETWPVTYTSIIGKDQVDYMIQQFYSDSSLNHQMEDNHCFFLALKQYVPVGFASFSPVSDSIYKLQKLYVLSGEQKTGAGKALLQTVEEATKSIGAAKLQLNVNRKNMAKSFYEKNGFVIIKETDIDIGNGYFMNDYIMQKNL